MTDRKTDATDPAGVEAAASASAGNSADSGPTGDAGPAAKSGPTAAGRDVDAGEDRPGVVVRDKRKVKVGGKAADDAPAEPDSGVDEAGDSPGPLGAELEALRSDVDELTRDLQRITAEYANYRKRVDRDRGLVTEQAVAGVLAALLPVLDDIDRAREHGDLVGPFGSVAEQLVNALTKFGLGPFGEKGDAFDPTRHEAVAHQTSAEVKEPTCVDVLRRGYLLGDRLLRPALVAVADPE